MTDSVEIISYTDYRGVPKKKFTPEVGKSEINVAKDTSTVKVKGKQACAFSFIKIPEFLEKPFNHEVALISRRFNYLRSNLMRDLFVGHAFVYPFTVRSYCTPRLRQR